MDRFEMTIDGGKIKWYFASSDLLRLKKALITTMLAKGEVMVVRVKAFWAFDSRVQKTQHQGKNLKRMRTTYLIRG